jgi:hypothetical protein
MVQEIATVINRALFHQMAPVHIRIINAKRNVRRGITGITHQLAAVAMGPIYRNLIIAAALTVDKGVIDFEENEPWKTLKINAIPHVRYI